MENVCTPTTKKKGLWKILGKRNIIILSVMLLIGLAVYLNYLWFYQPSDQLGYGDNNQTGADTTPDDSTETGGEAVDYFAATTLSRETTRRESIEVLQSVVDATEGAEREAALAEIAAITAAMEDEVNIETLIRAEGYANCVAVINGESASVVVSSENELDPTRVANITAIVYEQAGILPVNLVIKQK